MGEEGKLRTNYKHIIDGAVAQLPECDKVLYVYAGYTTDKLYDRLYDLMDGDQRFEDMEEPVRVFKTSQPNEFCQVRLAENYLIATLREKYSSRCINMPFCCSIAEDIAKGATMKLYIMYTIDTTNMN